MSEADCRRNTSNNQLQIHRMEEPLTPGAMACALCAVAGGIAVALLMLGLVLIGIGRGAL